MQKIQAHDQFVRTAMSDLRVARDFFVMHLPDELKKLINLENLELQPRSHINNIRKESIVDLLYKTKVGNDLAYLYLLVEHQSSADELMPFRILKYTCNVIEEHLKQNNKSLLPLVYPMVIYHAPYPYPFTNNINDIVDAPKQLVEKYFLKPFQLIDLGKIKDEDLKKHAWAGVMEFALKHIFTRDILPYLKNFAQVMRNIDQIGGRDYISIVLQYIAERAQQENKHPLFELINKHISPEVGDKIMTLTELFFEEGKEKGKVEGQLEIAQRLFAENMEITFIQKITNLPLEKLKAIHQSFLMHQA